MENEIRSRNSNPTFATIRPRTHSVVSTSKLWDSLLKFKYKYNSANESIFIPLYRWCSKVPTTYPRKPMPLLMTGRSLTALKNRPNNVRLTNSNVRRLNSVFQQQTFVITNETVVMDQMKTLTPSAKDISSKFHHHYLSFFEQKLKKSF